MRIWKTPDGNFLWEGPSHRLQSGSPVRRTNGEVIETSAEYYEATGAGDIVTIYSAPFTSCLEDDLYVVNIHVVLNSTLYRFTWRERFGDDTKLSAEIARGGLTTFGGITLPFDPDAAVQAYRDRAAPKPRQWMPPKRQVTSPPVEPAFEHLEAAYARLLLSAAQGYSVADGMVERLAPLIDALETACQYARTMEEGADSFDNRASAARYRRAHQHFEAAAREIAAACEALLG